MGATFLDLIVFNSENLKKQSLNDLSIDAKTKLGINITKQSLHDRFNENALVFLRATLQALLNKQISTEPILKEIKGFNRILIKDSICFQIHDSLVEYYPGSGGDGSAAAVRIQLEYDLLCGKITDLSLNAFNDQDAKDSLATIEKTKQGDLIVRDLAYMSIGVLQALATMSAFFLCRLNTNANVYELKKGEFIKIEFKKIVKFMRKNNISIMEKEVYVSFKEKVKMRLILHLMPQEEYAKRIRKAEKNNKKKNRGNLSAEYKTRAALNLFTTNALVEQIPAKCVWPIYRLRWQIELTFKVWKSICDIEKVKKVKKHRLECYIYAKLIFIVLGWQILWVVAARLYKLEGKGLSFYKSFKTLRNVYLADLRVIIMFKPQDLNHFIDDFYSISVTNHLLEKKKNKPTSLEFLITCLNGKLGEN